MNPLVNDWIEKAEGDYHAAGEKEDAKAAFSAVKVVRETMRRMLELPAKE
jgi:hypothetical protein